MKKAVIGAIDLGTTSTRFALFNRDGTKLASKSLPLNQFYPTQGWHEQDPNEYVTKTLECIEQAVVQAGVLPQEVKCIGITNQRETTVVWDSATEAPLYNSIVWDDLRTTSLCQSMSSIEEAATQATGLRVSPYFSASKMKWLIDNVAGVKAAIKAGTARFGTVDSWLVNQLTREAKHVTDISNASRTLLMDLKGFWDPQLLQEFGVLEAYLPQIIHNTNQFGALKSGVLAGVPITGSIGDQFAAIIGHRCIEPGSAKNTYGTGSFLLMNTGHEIVRSRNGLLTTVIGQFGASEPVTYALEASVESAGSCVNFLVNQLGLLKDIEELVSLQEMVEDSGDVHFVPAFSGLYAPYWEPSVRGLISGLTHHTTRGHIVRAALEGICFRTAEGIRAIEQDYGQGIKSLSADGGLTANTLMVQIQADLADISIHLPAEKELTALGAALTAGLGAGVYSSLSEVKQSVKISESVVNSSLSSELREAKWAGWRRALERARYS